MPLETPPRLEPWTNGEGKGFVIGDRVFGWAVSVIDGLPTHDEAWYLLTRPIHNTGITQSDQTYYDVPFYISPDGEVAIYYYDGDDAPAERAILQADGRLHTKGRDAMQIWEQGNWRFASVNSATRIPPIPDHAVTQSFNELIDPVTSEEIWDLVNQGWTPDKYGKGLVNGGQLYTWNTIEDEGTPHHDAVINVMEAAGVPVDHNVYNQCIEYISPNGAFDIEDRSVIPTIIAQDPRLKPDEQIFDWTWKTSDFWEDERRKDFPEDFEESLLEATKPRAYSDEEIRQLVQSVLDEGGVPLGQTGKALERGGEWIEWPTDPHGGPHHDEVLRVYSPYDDDGVDFWTIDIDGTRVNQTELFNKELEAEDWRFASFDADHCLGWDEGQEGKGLLLSNGVLHTWNSDDWEIHNDYIADQIEDVDAGNAHYLYIEPTGKVYTTWGTLGPEEEELIREADPRLYVDIDEGGSTPWSFGASTTT